ncbi:AAA family ATPase [Egicoccus sp. AB-alg2]|uniref:helix-turn-helix transcriptional regulator n=1 Tax=Egicoccus sp. AB-alg2 TaxID=3242693 RepID=UPI00359E179F
MGRGETAAVGQTAATPSPLVGRRRELAVIDRLVERLQGGTGTTVVVDGPAGSGRSAVLEAAAEAASTRAIGVLRARGVPLGAPPSYGIVRELLEPALRAAESPVSLLRGAAGLAAPLFPWWSRTSASTPGPSTGPAVVHGLFWLTVHLAETFPGSALLVVVDDLEHADSASLDFLTYLAARAGERAIGIVAARGPVAAGAVGARLDHWCRRPDVTVLRLRPLTPDEVAAMIARTPEPPPDVVAGRITALAGGRPGLVRSLLEPGLGPTAPGPSSAPDGWAPPEPVRRVVLRALDDLPAACRELANAVAVLGGHPSLRLAAGTAGLAAAEAEACADELAAWQVLHAGEPLRFRVPLVRLALLGELAAFERSRLHRRAAEFRHADGEDDTAVGDDLLLVRPGEDAWVVAGLRRAAAQASARGHFDGAVAFLERSIRESPAPDVRAELDAELALARAGRGDTASTDELRRHLDRLPVERRHEGRDHLRRLLLARGAFDAAAELADTARRDLPERDGRRDVLEADVLVASALGRGTTTPPSPRLRRLLADARRARVPDDPALAARLAALTMATGADTEGVVRAAEQALAADPLVAAGAHGVPYAFAAAALVLAETGPRAAASLAAAAACVATRGRGAARVVVGHWRATLHWLQGDLDPARAEAERALSGREDGWNLHASWTAAVLAHVHLDRGRLAEAIAVVEKSATFPTDALGAALVTEVRGRLAQADGDDESALALLLETGARLDAIGLRSPVVSAWQTRAAVVAAGLGRRDVATRLAAVARQRARRTGSGRCIGRALHTAGVVAEPGPAAIADLEAAVAVLAGTHARLDEAAARCDLGVALHRCGDRTGARRRLVEAIDLAERAGAVPLRERARRELRGAGGRYRPPRPLEGLPALTPSERRIVGLAASGRTNAAIARELFVTPKTVEWHLGNAYRKLGVSSRRDLPGPELLCEPAG